MNRVAPILSVEHLETAFATDSGAVLVVRDVSLQLIPGQTLGLVGESGSGKSVTALSVMGLLPQNARVVGGVVRLDGDDLLKASRRALRAVRGRRVGMVFQDSMTSLNPVLKIGRQITESLEAHGVLSGAEARQRAAALLQEVGISDPEKRLEQYPHQLSGGLRQRVAVALALAPNPDVLIADEPTTALDVTVQAQLLDLLRHEQEQRNMAMLLITHDLGVVAGIADRLCVMYAGRIVEEGPTDEVFAHPCHPYTAGLLRSIPRIDVEPQKRLPQIKGSPPPMGKLPTGCAFRPRCPKAFARCETETPKLEPRQRNTAAACWADDVA